MSARWTGAVLAAVLGAGGTASAAGAVHVTTSGAIAIANLDHLIAQQGSEPGVEDLLLARSRFLGDYEALDRAVALAEARADTPAGLLARARARSAVHRFADAVEDAVRAERGGADPAACAAVRASALVATGRAAEAVERLEAGAKRRPGYETWSAVAGARAALGRFDAADRAYADALAALDTTAPFPYAWVHFARGRMWSEQAGDRARGEAHYRRALDVLPEFAVANVHVAEMEIARGDLGAAEARLSRVVARAEEPEALALLGVVHTRLGDRARGAAWIARARTRYEALLARYPLAFAGHVAGPQ